MDALKLLRQQHREVDQLFERFEAAGANAREAKEQLCRKVNDALAVHAAIEERLFYPATQDARTEELLHEAVEEHLAARRLAAGLLEAGLDDAQLDARMKALQEQVRHHVTEEEGELFPVVRKMLDVDDLEQLGEQMETMANELKQAGEPRREGPGQVEDAAGI